MNEKFTIQNLLQNVFVVCLLFITGVANADEDPLKLTKIEKDWIQTHPVLLMSSEPDYAPFDFFQDGVPQGFSIDYMRLITDKLGFKVKYVNRNWNQLITKIKTNEIDLIHTIFKTESRDKYLLFSDPYLDVTTAIYIRQDNTTIKVLKDLSGKTVAVQKGDSQIETLKKLVPGAKLVFYESQEEALTEVMLAQVDATVVDSMVCELVLKKYQITDFIQKREVPAFKKERDDRYRFAVNKKSTLLYSILLKGQRAIKPAQIATLKQKWFDTVAPKINLDSAEKHWLTAHEILLTDSEKAWIKKHPIIRMGYDPDFPPVEFINKDGEYTGIGADYVKLLNKRLGLRIQMVPHIKKWADAMEMLKENKIDMLPIISPSMKRKDYFNFSNIYLKYFNVIVTRNIDRYTTGLSDFVGKKVTVPRGYISGELIRDAYPGIQVVEANSVLDGLKKVSAGQADAYVGDIPTAAYYMQQNNIVNLKVAAPADLEIEGFAIGVRKDWPELVSIINKGLASISNQEKQQISDKWVKVKYDPKVDYSLIWKVVLGFLLVVTIILIWNRQIGRQRKVIHQAKVEAEHARDQAKKAQSAAETANRTKSDFLANMSHEIRTPMNAVLGFAEILKRKVESPDCLHYIHHIHTSGSALLALINDILDLSKIEAGKMDLQLESTMLANFFEGIEVVFSNKIEEKGLDFQLDTQGLPTALILDQTRLRQILINLLGNAIKFTEKGKVTLRVKALPPTNKTHDCLNIFFEVEDTGIGIPKADLDKIFESFEQTTGQKVKKFGGTGLGLAISKRLTEMMNGKIQVESELGNGATFRVLLHDVKIAQGACEVETVPESENQHINFEPATILIADDVDVNREILESHLNEFPFKLIFAENGKEVIALLDKENPDLILLDMKMPIMNGCEVVDNLKNNILSRQIPIIAVTSSVLSKDQEKIMGNCDSHLSKPIVRGELIREISKFLPVITQLKEVENKSILNHNRLQVDSPQLKTALANLCAEAENLRRALQITKISNFASKVKLINEDFESTVIEQWANETAEAAHRFEIDKISALMELYISSFR